MADGADASVLPPDSMDFANSRCVAAHALEAAQMAASGTSQRHLRRTRCCSRTKATTRASVDSALVDAPLRCCRNATIARSSSLLFMAAPPSRVRRARSPLRRSHEPLRSKLAPLKSEPPRYSSAPPLRTVRTRPVVPRLAAPLHSRGAPRAVHVPSPSPERAELRPNVKATPIALPPAKLAKAET